MASHEDKDPEVLIDAARSGNVAKIQSLIDDGYDVNARGKYLGRDGSTALHAASRAGGLDAVRVLISRGAEVNAKNENASTPLHYAAWLGGEGCVRLLLEHEADVTIQNEEGDNPLHFAARFDEGCVRLLLEHKADVTIQNKDGDTPLHIAARDGDEGRARLLLEHKADVTIQNKNGVTPCQVAGRNVERGAGINTARAFVEYHFDNEKVYQAVINSVYDRDGKRDLINHHKVFSRQKEFTTLMRQPGVKRNTTKIVLAGYGGNGKTTLKESLQRNFLQAKLTRRSEEKAPLPGNMQYTPTPGIDVATLSIPKIGKFSVWDFAGQTEYYVTHNMFLRVENAVVLLVFKMSDDKKDVVWTPRKLMQQQRQEVTSWLAFLKAIIPQDMDEDGSKPTVILIGSKADLLKAEHKKEAELVMREILQTAQKTFGKYLNILDETFILNCHNSQHNDMHRLRECLRSAKREEYIPKLCEMILDEKSKWIVSSFPVIKWKTYVERVKELDLIIDEEFLKKATRYLHYLGEMLRIESTLPDSDDVIVLDPQWLCSRIFGPMLAPEIFEQFANRLPRKSLYMRSEIEEVFHGLADIDLLINLLKEFDLLYEVMSESNTLTGYVIPGLLDTDMPANQWKQDATKKIYYGRRFQCRDDADSFSPGFFPRLQTRIERHFQKINRHTTGIWKNGIKVCHNAECLVYMTKGWRAIHVCVRAEKEEEIGECYKLLETITDIVYEVLEICCPGTRLVIHVLSSDSLRNHRNPEDVTFYTLEQIREAEERNEKVYNEAMVISEAATDLLCAGYDPTILRHSGYESDVKWMLKDSLKIFSNIMDIIRLSGNDYRAMADLMGIPRMEVDSWQYSASIQSPTQHALSVWSKGCGGQQRAGQQPTADKKFCKSNFANLVKILEQESCDVYAAREEIHEMFRKLGV